MFTSCRTASRPSDTVWAFLLSCATLAALIYLARGHLRVMFEYPESRIRMERELSDVPGWADERD